MRPRPTFMKQQPPPLMMTDDHQTGCSLARCLSTWTHSSSVSHRLRRAAVQDLTCLLFHPQHPLSIHVTEFKNSGSESDDVLPVPIGSSAPLRCFQWPYTWWCKGECVWPPPVPAAYRDRIIAAGCTLHSEMCISFSRTLLFFPTLIDTLKRHDNVCHIRWWNLDRRC